MPRRQPARQGLTYMDANRNRLITEGPDILDIKAEILSRWGDWVDVFFDTYDEEWVVVEKCMDGVDRFVLSTKKLNQRVIDKLQKIDQAAHVQDADTLNRKYDQEDAQHEKDSDYAITEATGEGQERLIHALTKDGIAGIPQVFFKNRDKVAA